MKKKDWTQIEALKSLALACVSYVGQANYAERESHARRSLLRGFREYSEGKPITPLGRDTSEDES